MKTRPLTVNAQKIMNLRYGADQTEAKFQLDVDDVSSINGCDHPYYNYLFDIIVNALRNKKIKPFTQIELTEHAAGMTFAGLDELEKHLLNNGFPEGFKIFIAVDDDTHPMVREKALRLQRMCSHSNPYLRMKDYFNQPESDTTLYISASMRDQYEIETGNSLMNDLCKLISSGKLAPRTKLLFENNTILSEQEARQLSECITSSNPAVGFHVYIPTQSKDNKDIIKYQGKIWDFLEARQNADKALAMSVFLSGGCFNTHFTDGVFVDKGIAGKIYQYLDNQLEDTYQKAAVLQPERVKERLQSRKRWSFFKAAALAVGGVALAFGAANLMNNSK